jgi:ribonuclease PH
LQADGGTRVASVTAASLALELAVQRWVDARILEENIFKENVAAISVGVIGENAAVDLDYDEDKDADADFNFIMTQSGCLVEIQGTCEKTPISSDKFEKLRIFAADAIKQIFVECKNFEPPKKIIQINSESQRGSSQKSGMFSLANRLNRAS